MNCSYMMSLARVHLERSIKLYIEEFVLLPKSYRLLEMRKPWKMN